jgi:hypothetical protein
MAATSTGYIGIIDDGGNLDTFTGVCSTAASGGWWVVAGSNTLAATLSLSGGQAVFDTNMIDLAPGGSGTARPIGYMLANTASGAAGAFLRHGIIICPANGTVTAGNNVAATYASNGEGCVANATAGSPAFNTQDVIGIAMSAATSGTNNFALVRLNL